MFNSDDKKLTNMAEAFLVPKNSTHRQYEALRAFFLEGLPGSEVAKRFGYTEGSFRVLAHEFRQNPHRDFFLPPDKGPKKTREQDKTRQRIIALRKENWSIYDISKALEKEGVSLSPPGISQILKDEGFARLPRRRDDERPVSTRPNKADTADVGCLDLSPRSFRTKFAGLFLFMPYLAAIPLDRILSDAGLPGSKMVPADCAVRSLLGLKLFGSARHSHAMSYVLDEGLALFAGLNTIPKRAFLTEYSCRIDPRCHNTLMQMWFDAMDSLNLSRSTSLDLDFHTIPFHGEDALIEKHYVSKRSRKQKGILAFLAQDSETRVFCYANSDLRKDAQNDEILQFVQFWKDRTGKLPEELIFDSKLTTYKNLYALNEMGIRFITLRRRSAKMLEEIRNEPLSAWRRIELDSVSRIYKTPRILDRKIELADYKKPLRQIVITDFGHEEPTFLITNQLTRSAPKLITRYAQRMVIENNIQDGIDFFHMDALSSTVPMKVNFDLQLTLMASSLYRLLASSLGNGYQHAKSKKIFRDVVDASGFVVIGEKEILVKFQKRAHNPYLLAADFDKLSPEIPWLQNKKLNLVFG
jgi:transposase